MSRILLYDDGVRTSSGFIRFTEPENKSSSRLNLRMLEAGKAASGIFHSWAIGILRISNAEMVIKEFRGNTLRI